jgi:hypothetical protein
VGKDKELHFGHGGGGVVVVVGGGAGLRYANDFQEGCPSQLHFSVAEMLSEFKGRPVTFRPYYCIYAVVPAYAKLCTMAYRTIRTQGFSGPFLCPLFLPAWFLPISLKVKIITSRNAAEER